MWWMFMYGPYTRLCTCPWVGRGQRTASIAIPQGPLAVLFETGSLTGWACTKWVLWFVSQSEGFSGLRFLRAGVTCAYHRTWLLMWVLEIELRPSSLFDKHFLIESFSQPEIDLGQWHNALQMGHVKMIPSQGVSVHRKICTYFHCVYACYMCMCVCRCGRPLLSEVRGRGWVSRSLTLCLIPMRQVLSLSLEQNWLPASPEILLSLSLPALGLQQHAWPCLAVCVCVCFWDSNAITAFLRSLSSL